MVASVFVCGAACPKPIEECVDGTEDVCDGGSLPPDACNSQGEAVADATRCHLTVTTGGAAPVPRGDLYISQLEDGGVDQDWYFAQMPQGLTTRSLFHLRGGYGGAEQSDVRLALNVMKLQADGGLGSFATAADKHTGKPNPLDIIVPFSESGAQVFVLASDQPGSGRIRVDNFRPYSLYVEVMDNPDVNEPNDTTPTSIPLTAVGQVNQGSQTGFLATNDDVDVFSFAVSGSQRQIIYVHLTGPHPQPANPPPPYKLAYVLLDPAGQPMAEGNMANEFLDIDLSTAQLWNGAGNYSLKVFGYKSSGDMTPVRGDLRLQYNVEVKVMPDIDTQEPNDTVSAARVVTLSANSNTSVVGKISFAGDQEWFSLNLPARSSPSTLRYGLAVSAGGGRFDPLTSTPTRQVRFFRRVTTGATVAARQQACQTDSVLCPRDEAGDVDLVQALCVAKDTSNMPVDPPLCLQAQRTEELPRLTGLRNLVGALPIGANVATQWVVMIQDEGLGIKKYADDRDWTLQLEWSDDADEALGTRSAALGLSNQTVEGALSFGYGRVLRDGYFDSTTGIRGRSDYDAYNTDRDLFRFDFDGTQGTQAWELSWELFHVDGGMAPPGELALDVTFCTEVGPASDGGLCAGAQQRIVAYNGDSLTPWYLPRSTANAQALYSQQVNPGETVISVLPVACSCVSAPRAVSNVFYANVGAIHRTSNEPLRYRITQRVLPYPGAWPTCPVVDGGCGFAP